MMFINIVRCDLNNGILKNGSFIYLQEPFFQFWQYLRILILMQRYE